MPIGDALFNPLAGIALAVAPNNRLVALAVGIDGRLRVTWMDVTGLWQDLMPIEGALLNPLAGIALAIDSYGKLTALARDADGRLRVIYANSVGPWPGSWQTYVVGGQ